MRLFYFLLVLTLPIKLFAIDCYTSDIIVGLPAPILCQNLYINVNDPLILGNDTNPVIVDVTGEVIISANISVDGKNGVNSAPNGNNNGGSGGPKAGDGGSRNFGPPSDAQDATDPMDASNGKATINATNICGNGGSGGGFFTAGQDGVRCTGGSVNIAIKGSAFPSAVNKTIFTGIFRGGFGGGAGDEKQTSFNEVGTGGGGGGALQIIAGGDITINAGVTISARGGNGGNALIDGGAGGAGSGGVIWLKAAGTIHNSGTIDVRGGQGGRSNVTGGHGGNGGSGIYRLESSSGVVDGQDRLILTPNPAAIQSLKSDISCGTVKAKDQDHLFQLIAGFIIVMIVMELVRKILLNLRR